MLNPVTRFSEESELAKKMVVTVLSFFRAAAGEVFADGSITPDAAAESAGALAGRALRLALGTSASQLSRALDLASDDG